MNENCALEIFIKIRIAPDFEAIEIVHIRGQNKPPNLTAGSVCVMLELTSEFTKQFQALSRLDRLGQTKVVKVFKLASSGTVDSRRLDQLCSKKNLHQVIVDLNEKFGTDTMVTECITSSRADSFEIIDPATDDLNTILDKCYTLEFKNAKDFKNIQEGKQYDEDDVKNTEIVEKDQIESDFRHLTVIQFIVIILIKFFVIDWLKVIGLLKTLEKAGKEWVSKSKLEHLKTFYSKHYDSLIDVFVDMGFRCCVSSPHNYFRAKTAFKLASSQQCHKSIVTSACRVNCFSEEC